MSNEVKNLDLNNSNDHTFINKIPTWNNNPRPIKGLTPFGYFDNDIQFQQDGPRVAKYVAQKLGYPLIDIELLDINIYTCFEEATLKYSALINEFKIRENLIGLIGGSKNENLTGKLIKDNFQPLIRIAENYGEVADAGSNIQIHKASIQLKPFVQRYDLKEWANQNLGGKSIEIKRIYHFEKPAISRYFDPYAGTGIGTNYLISEFGWDQLSPAVNFVLMPVYEDILRLQAIELSNKVRKSSYSFLIENNVLTIFPIPKEEKTLWFDYILLEDRENLTYPDDNGDRITDASNVPFNELKYSDIKQWGKDWIRDYTLACSMIMLGEIRSKYGSIPIPDGEVSLDGDTLRNEGQQLKENLITQLRETLEQMMRVNQLDQKQREAESLNQILQKIPSKIYIY